MIFLLHCHFFLPIHFLSLPLQMKGWNKNVRKWYRKQKHRRRKRSVKGGGEEAKKESAKIMLKSNFLLDYVLKNLNCFLLISSLLVTTARPTPFFHTFFSLPLHSFNYSFKLKLILFLTF